MSIRRLELPVKGGSVIFSWPEPLDRDDISDVRELLQITLASMERRSATQEPAQPESEK